MTVFGSATLPTATLCGTRAVPVEVQVDVAAGLPAFIIVGMGDTPVMEARDRVRAALRACGFTFPSARVVVNLAPAPLRKHGTGFDLPIAAGILAATHQMPPENSRCHLVGELSLDGGIRPVPGILAHALAAREDDRLLGVPRSGAALVGAVPRLRVHLLDHLSALRELLHADPAGPASPRAFDRTHHSVDLADIHGHDGAKRVLEVAAAGGHDLLLIGPPGAGKTMLARAMPGILPSLTRDQALDSAVIHDVAGLDPGHILTGRRPFRAPHHTSSTVGLVGGSSPPRPGEISLAHNGVLFLDELPLFSPSALQALRQPLEDGLITLVRAEGRVTYPAEFSLIAAANPCPCGFAGDPDRSCTCAPHRIQRYANRIGGPLLDRIDLTVRVDRIDPKRFIAATTAESSADIAQRVAAARERATSGSDAEIRSLSGRNLLEACKLTTRATEMLATQARMHHLSGRGLTRLLRVARTIAHLEGTDGVSMNALAEAIGYRGSDTP